MTDVQIYTSLVFKFSIIEHKITHHSSLQAKAAADLLSSHAWQE